MTLTTCQVCGRTGLLVVRRGPWPRPHIAKSAAGNSPVREAWCIGDGCNPPTYTDPPSMGDVAQWRKAERAEVA